MRANRRAFPEVLHRGAVIGVLNIQVIGEHIGKSAHLSTAHGIGLTSHRKRAAARLADTACGKMTVEDRTHLVGPALGLVDPLRIDGDDLLRPGP